MTAELKKYQWTTSGMRPDDSDVGAMWYYRGFDTDLVLLRLDDELDTLGKAITLLKQYPPLVAAQAELAETCNCRFEVDGEQTMWCPAHLKLREELRHANEMIELLKASRANGDVLAELVEKTEELKSKDGHIRKVREMVLAHADADVVAQLSRLEQAPTDGKTLCWHVCHEPSHFEPGGLYDGWVRPTVCPQCGEQSQ